MHIGASTANLYPMNTEDALDALLRLGFRELEVFVNTESEIAPSFLRQLKESIQAAGARVVSLHPYISGMRAVHSLFRLRTAVSGRAGYIRPPVRGCVLPGGGAGGHAWG